MEEVTFLAKDKKAARKLLALAKGIDGLEVTKRETKPDRRYWVIDEIKCDQSTYRLNRKIRCSIKLVDDVYLIEYGPLGISVFDTTLEYAKEAFAFSFAEEYDTLVLEKNGEISEKAKVKGRLLKSYVNEVS